jgi:hypothetical protein
MLAQNSGAPADPVTACRRYGRRYVRGHRESVEASIIVAAENRSLSQNPIATLGSMFFAAGFLALGGITPPSAPAAVPTFAGTAFAGTALADTAFAAACAADGLRS